MDMRYTCAAAVALAAGITAFAATPSGPAPDATSLERPRDLRELVFLSSGFGMAYGPARNLAAGSPPFTNVFVRPEAYRAFMKDGVWPEGTAFFLEIRQGRGQVSVDSSGRSQGELLALEAAVKDTRKYPDGWAYFDFGPGGRNAQAQPEPRSASCYSCHSRHGAVEWTFTQFYPEQFAVARSKGTVRRDYDPGTKVTP